MATIIALKYQKKDGTYITAANDFNSATVNENYRYVKFEKPATGNLLTWLEANAVRLPLIGTYVFNNHATTITKSFSINCNFIFADAACIKLEGEDDAGAYLMAITSDNRRIGIYTSGALAGPDKVITFTQPVQYQGNEEFVKWFTANAKPLPAKGKTLNEYTWDEISRISLADKAVEYGFKVGDAKEVTLNGSVGYGNSKRTFSNQKYWVYIIGINHNEAKEGKGIAFQGFKTAQSGGIDIAVTGTNYGSTGSGMVMNGSNTNAGGWHGSWAHTTCMTQWKNCFPSELQAVIRSTILYTDNTGNSSASASAVTANTTGVYYLAEYEVFGSNRYANANEPAQQAQYDYYKAGNSKVKYRSDNTSSAVNWWLRSPHRGNSSDFCSVRTGGAAGGANADYSFGSAPCFKV